MSEKVEYEKRWCKYEFTAEELSDIAEKLAIKTQELEEVEDEKKAVMSSYKERLERIAGDVKTAARFYKDRYEMRDIECVVERDFETGEVRFVRTDTGQIAHREKMTMADRQRRIEELIPDGVEDATDAEIAHDMAIQREMRAEKSAL